MSDLYQLEHKIIPHLLFPDKEGRKVSPFRLGNNFSEICLDILRRMHGIEDESGDMGYSADDFAAEPVTVKDNGKPAYYITRLRFPFMEDVSFSTLCPRVYMVHGLQGENLHYYTIEYDQPGFERGNYWLCRWKPRQTGGLIHANMGTIGLDEEGEVRLLMEKCNEDFGIV